MKKIKIQNNKEYPIGKIVCVGINYKKHGEELWNEIPEYPLIFLKPLTSVIFSGDNVIHPNFSNNMHYEAELLLLIGKTIKNATPEQAEEAIIAYGAGLDMTLRDIQEQQKSKGFPWTISKGFDTSAVLSEFISKEDYKLTLKEKIQLSLNGEIKQNSDLSYLLHKPIPLTAYLSNYMTLEEGDIIFTGTPEGVGKVVKGDKIVVSIENIALLETEII